MYIESSGATGRPAVMFLHGSMVAGWMWEGQIAGLPQFRCLVPDLPGFGKSGEEPWTSFSDSADQIAELIRQTCDAGSAHLVGLSLGGLLALHVGARHPSVVRSLLVSGVPQGALAPALRAVNRVMLALYSRSWGARIVARMFGIPRDESGDRFLETARQTDPGSVRAVVAEVSRGALPAGLDQVSIPTLLVVGEKDTKPARRAVPYLQEIMPDARGCLVPEVGHQWNAENPALFTDMVSSWVSSQAIDHRLLEI